MARVSYVDEKGSPELAALAGRIKSSRVGALLNIYKLLMHSPPLAESWLGYVSSVRFGSTLEGRLRELITVRIAHLNDMRYVLQQHVPKLAQAEGVSAAECEALKDWRAGASFSERERAALAYADAMVAGPQVPDATFEAVRRHFDERQTVELTVLIGTYLMHNRVFNALRVDLETT